MKSFTPHFICPGNVYRLQGRLYLVVYCWSFNAIQIEGLQHIGSRMVAPHTLREEAVFIGSNYKEKFNG